jgi:ribosomal protein S18 acetylase RimI-like enzyme
MRLTDPHAVRAHLETDRAWAVYALGDLAPGFYEHTEWHCAPGPVPALLMLYRAFRTPVLFTHGPASQMARLLDDIAGERTLYLSIRPDILPSIEARYTVDPPGGIPMWRMTLDPGRFRPAPANEVRRLSLVDLPALEALFADGAATGEAPDFFSAAMLEQGIFYGVSEDGALVSAAGTHLVSPELGVAAVGNVYIRRDRRGRGLAAQVTSAVTAALVAHDPPLSTVALNVHQHNAAALRVYERLGYQRYCAFFEGMAKQDERRRTNRIADDRRWTTDDRI